MEFLEKMIANIDISSSPRGALIYNYKKLQDGEALILKTNKIWPKYSGEEFSANELAYIFEERAAINKNTKNPFVHISLNPHPDDVLTDEQLTKIADEYMKKMGYGDQPYIVFKHEDIDRRHLHIVTTNLDAQGKKIEKIDSNNHYRSQKATRELERHYNLHPAVKQNEDKQVWQSEKVDTGKNITLQIRNIVKHITHRYKFQSFEEYRTLLSLYNIDAQEVKGEAAGNVFEGIIYFATGDKQDKQNRAANPVKSSVLGKFAGAKNLKKIYEKSATAQGTTAKAKDRIKADLSFAMKTAKSEVDLYALLRSNNVDLVLRKNEAGRIYGTAVIDHKSGLVMNGSRLGKAFSANAFHLLFERKDNLAPVKESQDAQFETQFETQRHDQQRQELHNAGGFGWMPEQSQSEVEAESPSVSLSRSWGYLGGDSLFNAVGGAATKYIPPKKRKKKKKKDISI